ncbi:MAG TPA: phospholipase D-like domain-containing protein [Pyrinomonadaceae bacterium]|jgi:phosphatidylserine/phosphatidylglycerophosphate/cardiolipin synthase-like enzyme|nr:phospholipase D-like domain-containing protein [Pyrinomonadaceae bacterium]
MPFIVTEAGGAESVASVATLEMVPRSCSLEDYKKIKVPNFDVSSDLIAYASPDSTYAVTRRLLDGAKKEIVIGIYDFTADYMRDLLLNAMQRGVKVSLMLDIDSKKEEQVFKDLAKFGCKTVPAPSCASKNINFFPSSHEKVIVIDGTWTLVQSGNYSNNSIPFNEKDGGDPAHFIKGNRDMGVAIRSKPLAEFFAKLLRSDMKLELDAAGLESLEARPRKKKEPDLVETVPELLPMNLFPSKTLNPKKAIKLTPVLTPDNYMLVVPGFLESATKSIYIEQQYIRSKQADIIKLLAAIKKAKDNHPQLDVRIILGKLFSADDVVKEKENVANLKKAFGLELDKNIRYIDTKRFVHCHNKLIVVDDEAVLVSSQNWSNTGVGTNREAGVLMRYPDIAKYYSQIFESDWSTAQKTVPKVGAGTISPETVAKGNFVEVVAADYQDV